MNEQPLFSPETIKSWAQNDCPVVALHLKQQLLPVEGKGGIIFPPTYADIGYNIDELSDGTKVATIDSVGSQANRMEPLFKSVPDENGNETNPLASLVPQINIMLQPEKKVSDEDCRRISLLDLSHRIADAAAYSCPTLAPAIQQAFFQLNRKGNAKPLCSLAPTSLLFGVWDSRGGTGEKRPRLVRTTIRAWNIETIHAAAQFNSVWKLMDDAQKKEMEDAAKKNKVKLSEKGFADAPAIFRKGSKVPEYINGAPNPERRVLGGVLVTGHIERNTTINLVALRNIYGETAETTQQIRQYLLALAIIAAGAELDLFLREGCHLRYADEDQWMEIPRRGEPTPIDLTSSAVRSAVLNFAEEAVKPFKKEWPEQLEHAFDLKKAKELLAKKSDDEESEG